MENERGVDANSVELTFETTDQSSFFVEASERATCDVVGEEVIRRADGRLLEFLRIRDADPAEIAAVAADSSTVERGRTVRRDGDEFLYKVVVSSDCVATTLADAEAVLKRADATDGVGTVVVGVPPTTDVRTVVEAFVDAHDARLTAKRSGTALLSSPDRGMALPETLTEKQRRAVKTAFAEGYLSWPRTSTAEECAASLGVSQPTFSQHLYLGLEKILTRFFES
ncbi:MULTISPECIES: bacterio-opsin activator domain-containing protein [Halorussus]|uniref:helix-turn-helix domain-containing protein n=1 Tax=Halorussus TaxID=1070314 RepID=UPI00209DD4DC|nr:bacterio-opsin activator domain-containing protein [Halorussus vallis]USZ74707.1 helix-turn-helix domain-containing protein [Halorussus vallis]